MSDTPVTPKSVISRETRKKSELISFLEIALATAISITLIELMDRLIRRLQGRPITWWEMGLFFVVFTFIAFISLRWVFKRIWPQYIWW